LGGFAQQRGHDEQQETSPWQASWQLGPRSHDFFRLLLDGIELKAAGFQVDLHLKLIVTADPDRKGRYWQIERPGERTEDFLVGDFPPNFSGEDSNYLGQCWLLWVCAVSTAAIGNKSNLFEQAYAWCKDSPNAMLRQLFWRECLADRGHWEGIPEAIRELWWDRALQEKSTIPVDCFLAHVLASEEFSEAWSVLSGRDGKEVRDTRRVLHWWRNVLPEAVSRRLPGGGRRIDLVSALWPVPRPNAATAEGWKTVLAIHIRALNRINAQKGQAGFAPSAVLNAWRAGQVLFSLADCLDVFHLVACFSEAEPGSRWGVRDMEAWIVALDGERPRQLKELAEGGELELGSQQDLPRRYLTLLLIAALRSWQPGNLGERARLLSPVALDVGELGQALENVSKRPSWWPD
jgi:hypothetical protein